MSIKRVAESVDLNLWIPATVEASVDLTAAILRIFRDEGGRKDRQKGRLMWLIEDYGEVKEVKGHPQASEAFRKRVVKEMSTKAEKAQPKATAPFERRSLLGVHSQPQAGKSRVGVHVPVGRLSVAEARQIADLADRYSGGEVRLTVEQNVILPNVEDSALQALLAEPSLNGASRLSVEPGNIVGNVVSCTGAQFCGLAMIETKGPAEIVSRDLQKRVTVPKALRIHWTGCPNSCGQVIGLTPRPASPLAPPMSSRSPCLLPPTPRSPRPSPLPSPVAPKRLRRQAQAADIGLMGGPAKKWSEAEGKMKAVPGCQIFIGGTIGATKPTLSLNTIPTLALITTPTHRHGDTAPALALSFALALALALALTKPSGEPKDPHPTLTRPPPPPCFQAVHASCHLITPVASPRLPCGPPPPSALLPRPLPLLQARMASSRWTLRSRASRSTRTTSSLCSLRSPSSTSTGRSTPNSWPTRRRGRRHAPAMLPPCSPRPPHAFLVISRSPVNHRTISAGARRAGRRGAEDRRVRPQSGQRTKGI
jgi:hypothetical protein